MPKIGMKSAADDRVRLLLGDCLKDKVLYRLPAGSVDSVVTDPPYALEFMGKSWDSELPGPDHWRAVRRVLKPGGYLLSFGGTRTFHRLACYMEEADWEICDTLCWLYGSGFPKSKACLKPAWEPIILACKPGPTEELQIDECRVGTETVASGAGQLGKNGVYGPMTRRPETSGTSVGRWPANVVHDGSEEVMEAFAAFGRKTSGMDATDSPTASNSGWTGNGKRGPHCNYGDTGSAARFFYAAKASKTEREAGLDGLPIKVAGAMKGNQTEIPSRTAGDGVTPVQQVVRANNHPTVKPLALMRWLVKLVTPPGGVVLDPFLGSGSTGVAAVECGFRFVGIEREADYLEIARRRIQHATRERNA